MIYIQFSSTSTERLTRVEQGTPLSLNLTVSFVRAPLTTAQLQLLGLRFHPMIYTRRLTNLAILLTRSKKLQYLLNHHATMQVNQQIVNFSLLEFKQGKLYGSIPKRLRHSRFPPTYA
jgi:hypothetical protein